MRGRVVLLCTGSRNMEKLPMALDCVLDDFAYIEQNYGEIGLVVEGGARGADFLCRRVAERRGIPRLTFPAQWDKYDKAAGRYRNEEMYDFGVLIHAYAPTKDVVALAYPAPDSIGTRHMMGLIEREGWPCVIHDLPKLEPSRG